VPLGQVLDELSPYARVSTAVAPFILAVLLRMIFGATRLSRVLFSISVTWLAIHVLLTPYSVSMQRDLESIRGIFQK